MNDSGWLIPLTRPVLEVNQVHVLKASLRASESQLATLVATLSPDELARANAHRFQDDRRRFVVARGMLRTILARYLRAEPQELQFIYCENGKPELAADLHSALRFSVSHSHDRALFAITRDTDVGIDIEKMHADLPVDSIAQMFFSQQEQVSLTLVSDRVKQQSFFACWCRKEAVAKALGGGLLVGLDRFTVSVIPGEPAKLLSSQDPAMQIEKWSLIDLGVGDEYRGAVAMKATDPTLMCWDASALWDAPLVRRKVNDKVLISSGATAESTTG